MKTFVLLANFRYVLWMKVDLSNNLPVIILIPCVIVICLATIHKSNVGNNFILDYIIRLVDKAVTRGQAKPALSISGS